jgi:predicted dehydrogenase
MEHENCVRGSLAVDVVSRKAVRNLEIFSEDLYIAWDGSPEGLYYYDYAQKKKIRVNLYDKVERQTGYSDFVVENAYMNEIEAFFDQIKNGAVPKYDFSKDKTTLALIDEIERGR